jgi:dopamine beta-monooxygenase
VNFTPIPDTDPHVDFLNQNVLIPNVDTTYWCTRFELPSNIMKKPHHIIRFDGVVSPQSDGVVHHMELFHCDVDLNIEIAPFNGPCTSEQKPMGLTPCRRVIGAWALGATNFTYPEEAGGFIGGPKSSRFLVLEVHFNNPYFKKGIIDQSGIRIYYTPTLRKSVAAIMEVGLEYNAKNSIPPQLNAFRISGYCASECTQASLPSNGITVFASQLHTHLTGVQVFTRIIKKNGNIVTLNADRHYSPHFQEIRLLPEPVRIERGDTILHTCIYNTDMRENMTFGGYGIKDEMCVNYMHYYPRSGLELCKTSVSDEALDRFFQTMKQ